MCYHVSTPTVDKLTKQLPDYHIDYEGLSHFHVSALTRPLLPVTLNTHHRTVEEAQWKLLPASIRNEDEAKLYTDGYNIESEYLFEKTLYNQYIIHNRGLLWVDGFYEPKANPITEASPGHFIYQTDKCIFSIGIIYVHWVNANTFEIINTFSILTTAANERLTGINEKNRMPLIIAPDDRDAWLRTTKKEEIQSLMIPFQGDLKVYTAEEVNSDKTINIRRKA